jgi:hypothetical protein
MLDSGESAAININTFIHQEALRKHSAPFILERDVPPELLRQIFDQISTTYNRCLSYKPGLELDMTDKQIIAAELIYLLPWLNSLKKVNPDLCKNYPLAPLWDKIDLTLANNPPGEIYSTMSTRIGLLLPIINLLPEKRHELGLNGQFLDKIQDLMPEYTHKANWLYALNVIDVMQLFPDEATKIDKPTAINLLKSSISQYIEEKRWDMVAESLSALKLIDIQAAQIYLTPDIWSSLKQGLHTKLDWRDELSYIEALSILNAETVRIGEKGIELINDEKEKLPNVPIPVVKAA